MVQPLLGRRQFQAANAVAVLLEPRPYMSPKDRSYVATTVCAAVLYPMLPEKTYWSKRGVVYACCEYVIVPTPPLPRTNHRRLKILPSDIVPSEIYPCWRRE